MNGILFDMDGVLILSADAHLASWRTTAQAAGLAIDDATFTATFGRTSRDIIRLLWGANTSDADVAAIDAAKEGAYRDLIHAAPPMASGVHAALGALRAEGFRLAVATSGPPENVELILDRGGLADVIDAVVHGHDVEFGKPAPDCFLLAAERLGLQPKACIVVEDAPVGLEAAAAAGIRSIGVTSGHDAEALRAAGAFVTVEDVAEVTPALVERVLGDE